MVENPLNKVRAAARKAAGAGIAGEKPAKSGMAELVDQIDDKMHQAENAARIGEMEMQNTRAAIQKIEQELEELKRKGADKDEWAKALSAIKSEQVNISRLLGNMQSAETGLPPAGAEALAKKISDIATEVGVFAERLEKVHRNALATRDATPEKALSKALIARPKGSAPIGSDTQTALHHGFKSVAEVGDVSANLERELNMARERINRRVLEIFDILDRGSVRLLNEEVYEYKDGQVKVVPIADLEEQLELSRAAMEEFTDIVGVLPQLVENLKADLIDSEGRYSAVAQRQTPGAAAEPRTIQQWDRLNAPRATPPPPVQMPAAPQMPAEPDFAHGAGESADVHGYGAQAVREIKERKARIDAETITILNTINEILSLALGFESTPSAYAYEYDPATQKSYMKVSADTWAATSETARALIPPMERLVGEIEQLITESRQAKEAIARKVEEDNKPTN